MVWRLVRKAARLYAFIAICVLGLMLASDQNISHQLNAQEAPRSLFFPYGVLAGLVISWIYMSLGAWISLFAVAGFYLLSFWQSGAWPQSNLPFMAAGAAPLFLLAAALKSLSKRPRK